MESSKERLLNSLTLSIREYGSSDAGDEVAIGSESLCSTVPAATGNEIHEQTLFRYSAYSQIELQPYCVLHNQQRLAEL
jgi:hypothetical protein